MTTADERLDALLGHLYPGVTATRVRGVAALVESWLAAERKAAYADGHRDAAQSTAERIAQAIRAEREAHFREFGDEESGPRSFGYGLDRAEDLAREEGAK